MRKFTSLEIFTTLRKWKKPNFSVYIVMLVIAGYFFGKHLALRDNAKECNLHSSQSEVRNKI